jgi:hypothetical protein
VATGTLPNGTYGAWRASIWTTGKQPVVDDAECCIAAFPREIPANKKTAHSHHASLRCATMPLLNSAIQAQA